MSTHLTLEDYVAALTTSGATLRDAARDAGPRARVPTCPEWTVTELVAHQGMVHRWATANLRAEPDHDTERSYAEGIAAPDPLSWLSEGIDTLVATLRATPEDVAAKVFLRNAPAPLLFWARRQAHETTIHSVDAVAATLGRWPSPSEVSITPDLAADGIDELLSGFITRRKAQLRSREPHTILVTTDDTGHAWSVRLSQEPVVTTVGEPGATDTPVSRFSGTAVQLYLTLWNRADEATVEGNTSLIEQWRSQARII
ncbi:maleylpyruvate isomerase N-terminal domain-containing protein [Halostreptopolyspora alba]|uniref:Maleylpyruvate isomerase family mycothiol-dependent enzyme n=1 Tax=Halostreptopolyspora alba TaxID=2487137 RepID=A0A3N0E486_9ACTN|nr:maleylpyruvate isomerase family mycothiol-dependent enzyme [Nocardiopsaceae bacterium YIM 96095]